MVATGPKKSSLPVLLSELMERPKPKGRQDSANKQARLGFEQMHAESWPVQEESCLVVDGNKKPMVAYFSYHMEKKKIKNSTGSVEPTYEKVKDGISVSYSDQAGRDSGSTAR